MTQNKVEIFEIFNERYATIGNKIANEIRVPKNCHVVAKAISSSICTYKY